MKEKKKTGGCEARPGAGGASGYGGLARVWNSYFIPRVQNITIIYIYISIVIVAKLHNHDYSFFLFHLLYVI
jgi:hypothetical protein